MLSNHVTIFSGGNGNLPSPCNINEVPKPNLSSQGATGRSGFARESRNYSYFFCCKIAHAESISSS